MSSQQLGSIKTGQLYCPQHINQSVNQVTQGRVREYREETKRVKRWMDGAMAELTEKERRQQAA